MAKPNISPRTRAIQMLTAQPIKQKNGRRTIETAPPSEAAAKQAISYLDIFGYLPKAIDRWEDITFGDIVKAIGLYQQWFGLAKTRQLDPQTLRAMSYPRCPHPDIMRVHMPEQQRLAEAVNANLPRWRKDGLTYGVEKYVPGLSTATQDKLIEQAFASWTRHGNLNIRRDNTSSAPDIVLSTGSGRQSNFDGPGGTLAWAYLPNGTDQQLEMRFDLAETWIDDPAKRGILYLNVATHEFGHLLGLDHSRVQTALMAPYYNVQVAEPQQNDDIPRFQARYGVRTTPPAIPVPGSNDKVKIAISGDVEITLNGKKLN